VFGLRWLIESELQKQRGLTMEQAKLDACRRRRLLLLLLLLYNN